MSKEKGYTTGIDKADDRLKDAPYTKWYYHNVDELMGLMRQKLRELNSKDQSNQS